MILSVEDIKRMQEVDVETVDKNELTDLNDIIIDTSKAVSAKLSQFAAQTNNLFLNKVGEYVVKVSYAPTDLTINDKLKGYLERMAEISF